MQLLQPILFLFGGIGVINGIIVALFLLFVQRKKIENIFLGTLVLAVCIRIGKSIYMYYTEDSDRLILQIGLSVCIFIGPLFYAFIKTARQEIVKVNKAILSFLAVLGVGIFAIGIFLPYRIYPDAWNGLIIQTIYFIWATFVLLGIWEMRDIFRKTYQTPKSLLRSEKRLLAIAIGMLFITCSYQFSYFIDGVTYLWGSLIFTSVFYYFLYFEISNLLQNQQRKKTTKNEDLQNGAALLQTVEEVMKREKLHKKASLKLKELATHTDMNPHLLSRVLNEVYPNGFATYVHEKRIEEAKELICSNSEYTLEGIGYEAGFNSKSSFFSTFKRLTGTTPAEYRKSILEPQKIQKT